MQVAFNEIDPNSRIWIYQADRELSEDETEWIEKELNEFIPNWTAHSKDLKAAAKLFYNRFLVLAVDEDHRGASGCSIDTSVSFVKKLEEKLKLNFFDRLKVCYLSNTGIDCFPVSEFKKLWDAGALNEKTPVFNNLIGRKIELEQNWIQPLDNTWLAKKIPQE